MCFSSLYCFLFSGMVGLRMGTVGSVLLDDGELIHCKL